MQPFGQNLNLKIQTDFFTFDSANLSRHYQILFLAGTKYLFCSFSNFKNPFDTNTVLRLKSNRIDGVPLYYYQALQLLFHTW